MSAINVAPSGFKVCQGKDYILVTNLSPTLATSPQDIAAGFVLGSPLVTVSVVQSVESGEQIHWQIASEDGAAPVLSSNAGTQVTFSPDVAGNHVLVASAGVTVLGAFRFAIVSVTVLPGSLVRAGQLLLGTGVPLGPFSGMVLRATCVLQSGTKNPLFGTDRVVVGNVGNLQTDTFEVAYPGNGSIPDGAGKANPGGTVPLLDSDRNQTGNGGSDPFRFSSCMMPTTSTEPGAAFTISSADSPEFWWASEHPATHRPFGPKSGGYTFMEYLVAYSLGFLHVYTPLTRLPDTWTAVPCVGGSSIVRPTQAVQGQIPKLQPPLFDPTTPMTFDPAGNGTLDKSCQGKGVPDTIAMDFALGETVGHALTAGCDVVYAELLTGPPIYSGSAMVRVQKAVQGVFSDGEVLEIAFAPDRFATRALHRLSLSWVRTEFQRGKNVMAVLTRRRIGALGPGDPVVVTSRDSDFKVIENLVAAHSERGRGVSDPAPFIDIFAGNDAALAGYAYSRLGRVEPQMGTDLRFYAIGSRAVPPPGWVEIAEDITAVFPLLERQFQTTVVKQFLELAEKEDFYMGSLGFRGLGRIARFEHGLISQSDSNPSLVDAYRRLVGQGMRRELALEAAFSINMGSFAS